jgi:MoaA/NifB/PqqE/SkfB family radical SAM enzyme
MIDASGPEGDHMPMDTFERALDFIDRCQVKMLLVSGGEPFEHPDVFRMAAMIRAYALEHMLMPAFASNGHFALDDAKMDAVRRTGIGVQVTCDPRYYERVLLRERFSDPQFTFEDHIRVIFPCRRA